MATLFGFFPALKYDLIVSDVQMPVMNGIELLQWVRANVQTPLILMSGFSRLLELMKPKDIGAKAFLRDEQNQKILGGCTK